MRVSVVVLSLAVACSVTPALAVAAAPSTAKVCTQLKDPSLPSASYLSSVSGIKSKGNQWTVLATGVDCTTAISAAGKLLPRWKTAALGATLPWPGYTCFKMTDSTYAGTGASSGGFICHQGSGRATSVFQAKTFAVRETYPYSVAQVKAFFGIR